MFSLLWLDMLPDSILASKSMDIMLNHFKTNRGIVVKRVGVPRLVLDKLIAEYKSVLKVDTGEPNPNLADGEIMYKGVVVYYDSYMFGRHMLVTDYEKI